MIWNKTSTHPEENQIVWALDEDDSIYKAKRILEGYRLIKGGFIIVGITHWAKIEEIKLPDVLKVPQS